MEDATKITIRASYRFLELNGTSTMAEISSVWLHQYKRDTRISNLRLWNTEYKWPWISERNVLVEKINKNVRLLIKNKIILKY